MAYWLEVELAITIGKTRILMTADGEPVIRWQGNPDTLSAGDPGLSRQQAGDRQRADPQMNPAGSALGLVARQRGRGFAGVELNSACRSGAAAGIATSASSTVGLSCPDLPMPADCRRD
jgi:hypothetical protein